MTDIQYFNQIKKGSTVSYGEWLYRRNYTVQSDGIDKNGKEKYLHIIVVEEGKRKKIGIDKLKGWFLEPGTEQDFIFNRWFLFYTLEEFLSFSSAELAWVGEAIA